jgi:hypothetical protein
MRLPIGSVASLSCSTRPAAVHADVTLRRRRRARCAAAVIFGAVAYLGDLSPAIALSSAGTNFGSTLPPTSDGQGYQQISVSHVILQDVDFSTSNYYYATQAEFNSPSYRPQIEAKVSANGVGTVSTPGLFSSNAQDLLVAVLSTAAGGAPRPIDGGGVRWTKVTSTQWWRSRDLRS